MIPEDSVVAHTQDGWTLPIRHYRGDGPVVLLVHGMGANHRNWDFDPSVSPVDELVELGYDVWIPSLRGDPESHAPDRASRTRISFDDHAIYDIPAVLDAVHAATGQDQVLWVGHSMGGMLLYTTLVTRPHAIRAGVAIASPATFEHPLKNHKAMRSLGGLAGANRGRLPLRTLARAFSGFRPVVRQLGNPDQMDRGIVKGMAKHTLQNLPRLTARQARGWLQAESLTLRDGSPWLAAAPAVDVPLLVMGAPDDHIASERDVAHACTVFRDCEYVLLGQENGFKADYGHVDPVIGTRAHAEVYPRVFDFLAAHRD